MFAIAVSVHHELASYFGDFLATYSVDTVVVQAVDAIYCSQCTTRSLSILNWYPTIRCDCHSRDSTSCDPSRLAVATAAADAAGSWLDVRIRAQHSNDVPFC